ncbi:MAG: cupredoxin domain-containing protein [Chloroflexota bacterium]|nr:cupredoxin domain-containing protein [Chloroflexota bacterium]MDQ5864739.1 cupredoxin domain-containing protein [Chloroflexota bacterium]
MTHTSHPGIRRWSGRRLASTLLALCLPVFAATFFSGGFFNSGSGTASQVFDAPAAHAAPPQAPQSVQLIYITNSGFSPSSVTIGTHTEVRWVNNSSEEARIRSRNTNDAQEFRTDDIEPGQTSEGIIIGVEGTFEYEDDRNEDHVGTIIVAAGAGGPTPTATGGLGSTVQVDMVSHDRFSPRTIWIKTGTTVRWNNEDGELHTASSVDGSWSTRALNDGESDTVTFLNPGTYNYLCNFHQDEMFGTVVVSGAAISPTPGAATNTPSAGNSNVNIQSFQFQPKDHVVSVGATVRWTNLDADTHTATSESGAFNTGNLSQGAQSAPVTFNTPGVYNYICAIHPSMKGSITVLNGDGSVPTAGPSNTPTMTRTPQPTNTPGGAPMTDVSVLDFSYSPGTINVQQGATVRWTNNGAAPHTVSSVPAGQFESGNMNSGQTFQFTFNTPGTYNYKCAYHSNMTGTVNVLAPGSTPVPQPSNTPRATATPMSQPSPGTANVAIRNYAYDPKTITVNLGDKVIWTGFDTDPHSVTSMGEHAGLFDSGEFGLNGTYERVFDMPGTYKYYCTVHGEFMSGTVIVQGSGGRFADVAPSNTFYPYIVCLADRGVIGGYSDGTYRPSNPVTRGQLAKIIANSAGFGEIPNGQTFADVTPGSPFYEFVERIASRNIISGYACGGTGEPCGAGNKPYFRPGANASRGQIAKIVAGAANLSGTPSGHTFADVPTNHTFYTFVEQLAANGSMSGYPCGGTGEQCDGQNRPYFRPSVNTTRGQLAKIVSTSFFPECGF